MNKLTNPVRNRRRLALGLVVGTVVIVSLAGAIALREVFARPGEAALRYVPADSIVVVSVDLTPSPSQALAFKHIDDSLGRNGMGKYLETSFLDLLDKSSATEGLKPLVLRNGALCVTPNGPKPTDQSVIGFLAVTDGPQANQILQKSLSPQFFKGLKYYKLGKSGTLVMVMDDLLVLTNVPQSLMKVKAIHDGEAKPITSVAEFATARHQISDDANLVCFMSPNLVKAMAGDKATENVPMPDWGAVGVAIRDGGIGISCAGKMDVSKYAAYKSIGSVPTVRADLFDVLPAGAYGMFAVSDPADMFKVAESNLKDQKDVSKAIAQAEDGIQKGVGLSVNHDLVPALSGDTVAALYPSGSGAAAGVDLLVVVDDTNSANPSDAVDRFKSFLEQQAAKEGNAPAMLVERKTASGAREFRVTDKIEKDFRDGFGKGMEEGSFNKDLLVGNKTIAYAFVGKAVLAASSQELLDKAVACYSSKTSGLAGDAMFSPSKKDLLDSQSFITFSISRIAEGVKNTVRTTKMDEKNQKLFNSIVGAFESLNEPLYIKGKASADGLSTGGVFIPLDYDKLLDIVGGEMKKK